MSETAKIWQSRKTYHCPPCRGLQACHRHWFSIRHTKIWLRLFSKSRTNINEVARNNPHVMRLARQEWQTCLPNAAHILPDFSSISALKLAQLGVALDFEENLIPSRAYNLGKKIRFVDRLSDKIGRRVYRCDATNFRTLTLIGASEGLVSSSPWEFCCCCSSAIVANKDCADNVKRVRETRIR